MRALHVFSVLSSSSRALLLGLALVVGCHSETGTTTDGAPDSCTKNCQIGRDATASVEGSVHDSGPKPDALKSAGQACQAGTECVSGTCAPAEIAFEGKRSQAAAYNAPLSSVGTLKTQGILCHNASGPALPFPPATVAYVSIGSPNPGVEPYSMSSTSHRGFSSLKAYGQTDLRYDLDGMSMVTGPVVDLRSEGPIPFTDARLKATDNLVFFVSERKAKRPEGHLCERRTYTGGTFKILTSTGTVVASGKTGHVSMVLDYSSGENFGWGEVTMDQGSAFETDVKAIFGSSKLKIVVESVQSPNWADSPKGVPVAETYAIFNMGMKTVPPEWVGVCN